MNELKIAETEAQLDQPEEPTVKVKQKEAQAKPNIIPDLCKGMK